MNKLFDNFNNKKMYNTLLIIAIFFQLFIPISMIFEREMILLSGKEFKMNVEPYDPYDYFRGNYLNISVPEQLVSNDEAKEIIDKAYKNDKYMYDRKSVYVTLKNNSNNYATYDKIYTNKPMDTSSYLRAELYVQRGFEDSNEKDNIMLRYPISKFYINEKYAKDAERLLRDLPKNKETYIKVKIYNGEFVVTNVFVDDKDIYQYIDK